MMEETLTPLIVATLLFVGSHFLLSARPVREPLLRVLGRWGFMVVYSLVAIATFVWMTIKFSRAPILDVWPGVAGSWWVALVLMLLASALLVCGILTRNPTAVMSEGALKRPDAAIGIFKVTRHPIMWAVLLWSVSHMLNTGDVSALIYFGGLGVLALFGMMHMDARRDAWGDPDWQRFRAQTSLPPFAAIAAGRTRVGLAEIGWVRLAISVAFYLLMLHAHEGVVGIVVAPWVRLG